MRNRLMEFLRFIQGCVNRLCHSLLGTTPSPVSPSPCQGEGEEIERGASPLLYTPLLKEVLEGLSPSFPISPFPLKERGIEGVR